MSSFQIKPSRLGGALSIPPSKSHTLRAILFALMAEGKSKIHHYLPSPDSLAMIEAIRLLGATVKIEKTTLEISGGGLKPAENVIDAGNSGQVLRFIGALASLLPTYTVITGDHSIRHSRPVEPLLRALEQLGAVAVSSRLDGTAPIIIKGPIRPRKASLPGQDSQPVSGLLIAASFLEGTTEITVTDPGEKPWIDMTLHWLSRFGVKVENHNYQTYRVHGPAHFNGFEMTIPGDFSSAAFPIAAALITDSELTLKNLDMNDCQGDKQLIDVLIDMGAKIEVDGTIKVKRGSHLIGREIDVNPFIDAIPILSVIGCFAHGKTRIVNGAIARRKESDRIHCIATELKKMGATIHELPDGLEITHSPHLKGAKLESHRDHRIGMSLCVAALAASCPSTVEGIECIAKTYPTFAHDFKTIGASIESDPLRI